MMKLRTLHVVTLSMLTAASASFAADGLQTPSADSVWPRWQARVSLASSTLSSGPSLLQPPLSSSSFTGAPGASGTSGGSILGDYYFGSKRPSHFRASGGLLLGSATSQPPTQTASGRGLSFSDGPSGADLTAATPYLGLGYSGPLWRNSGFAIHADFGLVAERVVTGGSGTRALFGNQALDGAVRELRLSPLLQVGVSHSF